MNKRYHGFALPTILIASVVMLIVLLSSLSAASSVQTAINTQYYTQLAREAAEAGAARAQACYKDNYSTGTSTSWSDASPLKPSTNCDGSQIGAACAATSIESRCFVTVGDNLRTTFSVGALQTVNTIVTAKVTGTVELMRPGDHSTWRTYTTTLTQAVTYDQFGLSSGNDTSCAIVEGELYCWGRNDMGQVGDGTTTNQSTPKKVGGALAGKTVTAVSSGVWHTCAIANNNVYCWGDNSFAQFGNGSATALSGGSHVITPYPILAAKGTNASATTSAGITGIGTKTLTEISARDHTCVIASGEPWCWGNNYTLQAGAAYDSTTVNVPDATSCGSNCAAIAINRVPVRVGTMTNAVNLHSINASTSCVISSSKAYCWGSGGNYMHANGTTGGTFSSPVQVGTGVPFTSVTDIEVNNGRACAVNAGKVYCWGYRGIGSFGDYRIDANTTTTPTTPVNFSASGPLATKTLVSVAITDWTSCVLTNTGEIWCWGYNNLGQRARGVMNGPIPPYGDVGGTFTTTNKPQPVVNATQIGYVFTNRPATKLVSGNDYFCAMADGGATYCWGDNARGELGDGTTTPRSVPTRTKVPAKNILY